MLIRSDCSTQFIFKQEKNSEYFPIKLSLNKKFRQQ